MTSMADTYIFPLAGESREISASLQRLIKDSFWPGWKSNLEQSADYFQELSSTIQGLEWADYSTQRNLLPIKTYDDLFRLMKCLHDTLRDPRPAVLDKLAEEFPGAAQNQIICSVQLAARLWMGIYLTSAECHFGPRDSSTTEVDWTGKAPLYQLIRNNFPRCRSNQHLREAGTGRLEGYFSAISLMKICRINVRWTASLKDHLKFDHDGRVLHVYPHKSCLTDHLRYGEVFPKELLKETLKTLDLLFPFGDESTRKWLEAQGQHFFRISDYNEQRGTDLSEFRYWRRQLVELYGVFQQPPETMAQMWHDRRNPMQWYTFWLAVFIAVMTIVFGVISSYTGFKQIELAKMSYLASISVNVRP